jgi:hypothetical protein
MMRRIIVRVLDAAIVCVEAATPLVCLAAYLVPLWWLTSGR